MAYRRLRPEDLAVTPAEREAARRLAESEQAAPVGSAIGSTAGTALGALGLLVPGLGPVTMGLGGSLGGMVGGAIGSGIGDGQARQAEGILGRANERRTKALTREQLYRAALQAYTGRGA